jgi:DNA-binding transcriptional LysR family regulator
MMNVHHLELFYHVAANHGISRAARHMPYGIQQPAISKQIALLEEDLGLRLFARQPFRLTPAGEELFAFVRRFFDDLDLVADHLRGDLAPLLRIAASEFILREYVPEVITRMLARAPEARLSLHAGAQQEMRTALEAGKIDLAIAALDGQPPGFEWFPMVQLPLVLLVPADLPALTPEQLWAAGPTAQPLICPQPTEGICRLFQRGLKERGVAWRPAIVASSTALVTWFVAQGQGVGVSLDLPLLVKHPKVRVVPLPGFAPVEVAAVWRIPASPLLETLLAVIRDRAKELWPSSKTRQSPEGRRRRNGEKPNGVAAKPA